MKLSRFVRNDRGAAMVEFAFVLPIILLLFLGMIDFGRALFLYNNLANAAREGARFGAAKVLPQPTKQEVEDYANARIKEFSGNANAPALAVATIAVGSNLPDQKITVDIANYPFTPITPLPMLNPMTLSVKAVFRWEGAQ